MVPSLRTEKCPIPKANALSSVIPIKVSAAIQHKQNSTKNPKESAITAYLQRQHRNSCWLGTAKENTRYLSKHMYLHIGVYLHIQSYPPTYSTQ